MFNAQNRAVRKRPHSRRFRLFEALEQGPQPSFTELWTFSGCGERHIVSDSKLYQVAVETSFFQGGMAASKQRKYVPNRLPGDLGFLHHFNSLVEKP